MRTCLSANRTPASDSPQYGRIKVKTLGREVDLRVSTLPTLYGESVVMRLLDRSAGDLFLKWLDLIAWFRLSTQFVS